VDGGQLGGVEPIENRIAVAGQGCEDRLRLLHLHENLPGVLAEINRLRADTG
jgi:hypothetical protein